MHQTRPRRGTGTRHLATCFCTHLAITVSAMVSGHLGTIIIKNRSFSLSSMNCMLVDSIIEVFYHLSKMLIATKHIADNNFVFQSDSALAHDVCNIFQTSQLHFF